MKIVIIGAGISGCAAYLSLKKRLPKPVSGAANHEYTIYEAYDTTENAKIHTPGETHSASLVVGGGLGVGTNGLNVLKRLEEDVFRDALRSGYPYSKMAFLNSYGWNLAQMQTKTSDSATTPISASRHAFWYALRRHVPDGIIQKKRVKSVVANADGRNIVKFEDGSPDVEADLVLGADGLKSITRRALFPEAKEDPYPPHYEGVVGIGGFTPAAELEGDIAENTMSLVFGGNGFFGYCYSEADRDAQSPDPSANTCSHGDSVIWWSTYQVDECPDPKTIDKDAVLRDLRKRHQNWKNPVIQKIIDKVEVENMYPVWTVSELSTWGRDGVVLVGDAAHALPPTSGQGTSQALEDIECFSMILAHYLEYRDPLTNGSGRETAAGAIVQKNVIKQAAKKYMSIRQPRVKAILEGARRMESKKGVLNIFQEFMMYFVFFIIGLLPTPSWIKDISDYNIADEVNRSLGKKVKEK